MLVGDGAVGQLYEGVTADPEETVDVLYDLSGEGMSLRPKVYAQVRRRLRSLGK